MSFEQTIANTANLLIVPYSSLNPQVALKEDNGTVLRNANQVVSTLGDHINLSFNPTTTVPTNFFSTGSSNTADIELGQVPAILDDLTIQISLTETGGSNSVTTVPAPLMFQRIDVLTNGSEIMQTLYGEELIVSLGTIPDPQTYPLATIGNYATNFPTTGFGQPTAISASASVVYDVPLIGAFCKQMGGVYLAGLRNKITLRLTANSNAIASGTGTLSCTGLKLIGHFHKVPEDDKKYLADLYANNVLERPIIDCINYQVAQTFNRSNTYSIPLGSFNGNFIATFAFFRPTLTGSDQYTFTTIPVATTVGLQDQNGKNFNESGSDLRYDYLKYVHSTNHVLSRLFFYKDIVPFFHGDWVNGLHKGIYEGGHWYNSRDILNITFDANWSSGTYTLNILGYRRTHVHIDKGNIIVYKN
jgi:hypothetical protein